MNAPSPAEALVGAVLNGRWKLTRLLGEGGMGAVYEADGLRGEGKRAIKLLHPEFVKEDQILQRFFAEAQASKSLTHPNIAQVYESATAEDGTPYLVMELLQGTPLEHWVIAGNPIPPQHAVPVVYGVLQALTMAHTQRIVHRDLKPDNLFLVRDQRGNPLVKVLDFGIAKVMDAAGGMGQKTRTGVLLGTPGYMSPEQIKNSKAVDARSDLWSVGIILYELLTAKQPFPADNEFARLTSVLTEDVQPIEQVAPHLAAWGPFFRRALAKEPEQRFQTAEEMAQALMATSRGVPAQAAPASAAAPQTAHGTVLSMQAAAAPPTAAPPRKPEQSAVQQQYPVRKPEQSAGQQQYAVPVWSAQSVAQTQPAGHPAPAPFAGSKPTGATHVSPQKPFGTPTLSGSSPAIEVVQPPPLHKGAPWWLVGVVALLAFGLGLAVGLLVR